MVQMLHSYNSIYFWVFCGALFVNCLYPFVLFNTSSTWWRRDAVAFVDIGLVCFLPCPKSLSFLVSQRSQKLLCSLSLLLHFISGSYLRPGASCCSGINRCIAVHHQQSRIQFGTYRLYWSAPANFPCECDRAVVASTASAHEPPSCQPTHDRGR